MTKQAFITSILVTVLLCGFYGCSGKTDVSGIWKGTADVTDYWGTKKQPKHTDQIELMLAQTDKNISGNVKLAGESLTIDSGTIVDKTISLKTHNAIETTKSGRYEIEATVSGNSINGTIKGLYMTLESGGATFTLTGSFNATK